ncbi:MAG TPA: DUF6427 family protein [Bacteroidales bacterium]
MLKYFSSGHLSRFITIFFLIVLFWLPAFIAHHIYVPDFGNPLFLFLFQLTAFNIYLQISIALLITIGSALVVNQIAADFEFSSRFSSLAIFFFILCSSAFISFFSFNPILLANLFLFFFLKNIFSFPSSSTPITSTFNAGLLLGIASLFFAPLLIFLVFLWLAIIVHRMNDWRNFATSMIGILIPYLFLFTWYLWTESVFENANNLATAYFLIPEIKFPSYSLNLLITTIFMIVITVSGFSVLTHLREKNIKLRRNLMITLLYLVFTILLSILYQNINQTMLLIAIPASLILTNSVNPGKKMKIFNIVIYLLLALIVLNLYFNLGLYFINIF